MRRIQNAWYLAKASWQILSHDRELVAIPIVAGIAALLAFVIVAGPGVVLLAGSEADATNFVMWLILAVAMVAATWMATIGQATVMAGAAERMDGGDPTLGSSFAAARARTGRLLEWALLATVVALVLDQIEQRLGLLGNIVSWLGKIAFSVLSFLALPVIVFENVGAIEGFKRSSQLLRNTWGEQVTFGFGMGLLGSVLVLPAFAVGAALAATGIVVLQVIGVAAAIVWIILVMAVTSALSAVFKAALYRYAVGKPVDAAFNSQDLASAFQPR